MKTFVRIAIFHMDLPKKSKITSKKKLIYRKPTPYLRKHNKLIASTSTDLSKNLFLVNEANTSDSTKILLDRKHTPYVLNPKKVIATNVPKINLFASDEGDSSSASSSLGAQIIEKPYNKKKKVRILNNTPPGKSTLLNRKPTPYVVRKKHTSSSDLPHNSTSTQAVVHYCSNASVSNYPKYLESENDTDTSEDFDFRISCGTNFTINSTDIFNTSSSTNTLRSLEIPNYGEQKILKTVNSKSFQNRKCDIKTLNNDINITLNTSESDIEIIDVDSNTSSESVASDVIIDDSIPCTVLKTKPAAITDDNVTNKKSEGEYHVFSFQNIKLLIMNANTSVHFYGMMYITVLQGSVQLLGYTLNSSTGKRKVYSPSEAILTFKTRDLSTNILQENPLECLYKLGVDLSDMDVDVERHILPGTCLILCEKLEENNIKYMERHISQKIFPTRTKEGLSCEFFTEPGKNNVIVHNPEWNEIFDYLKFSTKVLIAGGKGVGKSTLLRYLVNKLLGCNEEVLVVDLDPGQPEFTVAGCVSACIVNQPLFGPNYTHLKKPYKSIFVPNIDVAQISQTYLNAVKELVDDGLPQIPIIINYMGFTDIRGLKLLSAVTGITKPNLLVEIRCNKNSQNFQNQLSNSLLTENAKYYGQLIDDPNLVVKTINSVVNFNKELGLQSKQLRDMCILSYLGVTISLDMVGITDCKTVYAFDLSQTKLINGNREVTPEEINNNLVALCSESGLCYGWGFVRGFNYTTNEVFLQTPLEEDEVNVAECLVLGSVRIPPEVILTRSKEVERICPRVPYFNADFSSHLGLTSKRFLGSAFKKC